MFKVEYIAVINSGSKGIDKAVLTNIFGVPKRTFTGYGSRETIVAASGLNFPFEHVRKLADLASEKNRERTGRKEINNCLADLDRNLKENKE